MRHVAGGAGETVKPSGAGHCIILAIAHAAPNPLSIPTTVTPLAHEACIASSAVIPSRLAPYPTLVGTATTGPLVSPPITLASAPSIPATTTTASAAVIAVDVGQQAMQPGDADVGQPVGLEAVCPQRQHALVDDRSVAGAGAGDQHVGSATGRWPAPQHCAGRLLARAMSARHGFELRGVGTRQQHGPNAVRHQLADDRDALLDALPTAVHRLGHSLAQRSVVIDQGVADLGERQPSQPFHRRVGVECAGAHVVDQLAQRRFVHPPIVAAIRPRYRVRREKSRRGSAGRGLVTCSEPSLSGARRRAPRARRTSRLPSTRG